MTGTQGRTGNTNNLFDAQDACIEQAFREKWWIEKGGGAIWAGGSVLNCLFVPQQHPNGCLESTLLPCHCCEEGKGAISQPEEVAAKRRKKCSYLHE